MHRLIMFAGSSPGAGKTTLSSILFEQFNAHGIPAQWLEEGDVVDTFERFVPELKTSRINTDLLLRASTAFVEFCRSTPTTYITDSFLPGFIYLYGRYPSEAIEQYSMDLHTILHPLNPLLIYLQSNVERALARAVQQRSSQWIENIRAYLNSWQLPLYTTAPNPFPTWHDLIPFFEQVDDLTRSLITGWPSDTVLLNTTDTSTTRLTATLLAHFGLAQRTVAHVVSPALLQTYTGRYVRRDESVQPLHLDISLHDNGLFVNTYWPNGTALLPESDQRFRLQSTNRRIEFDPPRDNTCYGLMYVLHGAQHRYDKAL